MIKLWKSLGFFLLFWSVTFYYWLVFLLERLSSWCQGHDYGAETAHKLCTRWGQALFRLTPGWSIVISGRESIPKKGAYVIVANHESATDILAFYMLGTSFRWLSKDTVFKLPLLGPAMKKAGYISISRGNKDSHKLALEESAQMLKAHVPMLFFPEGTRSRLGRPGPFKVGAFKLAIDAKVPILPVVIHGGGSLLTKGSLSPNPSTIYMRILPEEAHHEGENVEGLTQRVQKLIADHHKRLVAEVAQHE